MNYVKMKKGGTRRGVGNFTGGADMRFDEGVIGESYGVRCENFRFDSGALIDGYGANEDGLYGTRRVWSVWDFTRYDRSSAQYITTKMMCDAAGQVWHYGASGWTKLTGAVFTSPPSALVYRLYGDDTVIMTSETDNMMIWKGSGSVQKLANSPKITSFAMHYERMFATTSGEQNSIYFSDDLDPTNWNETPAEGGFIQLLDERGKLLKVVDFLNYVYIFREYGISRLTAYADQQDFYVVNLYVSGGRMQAGSVAQCGGSVMLLGGDGLYSFDGYDMTRRLKNICFDASPDASAVYHEGKYYLAARIKDFGGDAGSNNALVVYDVTDGGYAVSKLAIARIMTTDSGVYAVMSDGRLGQINDAGLIFGQMLEKVWESGYSDFGTPDKKELKEISVVSEKMVILRIIADGESYSYFMEPDGSGKPIRLKPSLAAHRFKFRLTSHLPGANIKRLSYVLK